LSLTRISAGLSCRMTIWRPVTNGCPPEDFFTTAPHIPVADVTFRRLLSIRRSIHTHTLAHWSRELFIVKSFTFSHTIFLISHRRLAPPSSHKHGHFRELQEIKYLHRYICIVISQIISEACWRRLTQPYVLDNNFQLSKVIMLITD